MKTPIKFILSFALLLLAAADIAAQELITNVYGRDVQSLNGKWDAIVDLYDQGRKNKIYLNRRPEGKTDFYEYSFDNGLRLDVPSGLRRPVTSISKGVNPPSWAPISSPLR